MFKYDVYLYKSENSGRIMITFHVVKVFESLIKFAKGKETGEDIWI